MSDMLGRSKSFLMLSKTAMSNISSDDSNMDTACFCAHQALELLLKYIIEVNGMQPPKTHEIDTLLTYAKSSGFDYSKYDDLYNFADKLNKWETSSRYGSGILTNVEALKKAYNFIEEILSEFMKGKEEDSQKFSTLKSLKDK